LAGPIPDIRQLGQALAEIREEKGLKSEKLAREADVDPSHVNKAENHGKNLTWETLAALAEQLDVPISQIASRAEQIADRDAQTGRCGE
jgi:transcriptional regulator with XRE-family HTH domain